VRYAPQTKEPREKMMNGLIIVMVYNKDFILKVLK
jgi:hypothetical protein